MTEFDTRINRIGSDEFCDQLVQIAEQAIREAVGRTESTGNEHVFGVAKAGDETIVTEVKQGTSTKGGPENVLEIREEVKDWSNIRGPNMSDSFHDRVDFFTILHTHPKGDPSPSVTDMSTTFRYWLAIEKTGSKLPFPDSMGQIGVVQDNILMTVMRYTGRKDRVVTDDLGIRETMDKIKRGPYPDNVDLMLGLDRGSISTRWEAALEIVKAYGTFCDTVIEYR
jgi:proteasome lid subunit RPN8/RPN11